jgi:hypothetical protein
MIKIRIILNNNKVNYEIKINKQFSVFRENKIRKINIRAKVPNIELVSMFFLFVNSAYFVRFVRFVCFSV